MTIFKEEVGRMWRTRGKLQAIGRRVRRAGRRALRSEVGQSMVEYAIMAALIAIVAMAAVQALGGGVAAVFAKILSRIQGIG
jgi:Flp pilus assembly pilin Flp